MPRKLVLHEDRLFPADSTVRAIARELYRGVKDLPIISPHGHTDPAWFACNEPFVNATEAAGRARPLPVPHASTVRAWRWRISASCPADRNLPWTRATRGASSRATSICFDGTPSSLWLNYVFARVFASTSRSTHPPPTCTSTSSALRSRT